MSYRKYLKLYTRNVKNLGQFAIRGKKDNNWIHSLKIKDKVDVFDGKYDKRWHVTTILKIEHQDDLTKIFIHYDGWPDRFDEWININHSQVTSTKLKKLHTFTPYHTYLIDPSKAPCPWFKTTRYVKCNICYRRCCTICFVLEEPKGSGNFQCKLCMDDIEYQQLFDAIYISLYNQYDIDINIIYLINDYSKGIIISCSNIIDPCQNEISYSSKFDTDFDFRNHKRKRRKKAYQYVAQYKHDAGTFTFNGQYRRIFCNTCYETRLTRCSLCYDVHEIRDKNGTICHRHNSIRCGYCQSASWYGKRAIVDCDVCCKHYCYQSVCNPCHICSGDDNWFKCNDCKRNFCNECQRYKTLQICNRCLPAPKSCDECREFVYDKMVYKCMGCDSNICIDCKEFYGFKGRKTLRKCNICYDKKQTRQRLSIGDKRQKEDISHVMVKEDRDCDDLFVDDIIIYSKYDKRRKCKLKEINKRKKRKNHWHYKRKQNKISNIKQRRIFNQRYALSLQY